MSEGILPPLPLGYARVGTCGRTRHARRERVRAAGCTRIFREKVTGAQPDRRGLSKLLKALGPGNVVTRIDRIARSTRDLLNARAAIADRKTGFRSLGDTWANITTSNGRLMLTALGGPAEFERELVRVCASEGCRRAVVRGVLLGCNARLTPRGMKEAIERRDAGEAVREIARSFNVSHSTISRPSA